METQKIFNSRYYVLAHPLFMSVTSADYYSPTKKKQKTFYVSSSCIFILLSLNDNIEWEVKVIANILYQFSTSNALIFSLRNFILAPLFFKSIIARYGNRKQFKINNLILDFPPLLTVPSVDLYLSRSEKYQSIYSKLSYIFTSLELTNTIEQELEVISIILCQISTGSALIVSQNKI